MNRHFLQYLNLHFWAAGAESLLAGLRMCPLPEEIRGLAEILLRGNENEKKAFSEDYERLIMGTDPDLAVPLWESVYTGECGRLLDTRTLQVIRCYAEKNVRTADASQPADYIGYETEFCLLLLERYGTDGPFLTFVRDHYARLLEEVFSRIRDRCRSAYFSALSGQILQMAENPEKSLCINSAAEKTGQGITGGPAVCRWPHFLTLTDKEKESLLTSRLILAAGQGNCGGKCALTVREQAGCVLSVESGKPESETSRTPAESLQERLRPCARGRAYPETFLRADRLRTPLLQTGERGSSNFRRISWEDAVSLMAEKIRSITDRYGPGSRYVNYATGVSAVVCPDRMAKRLLAMDGGYLDYYNSYSTACLKTAVPYMYGTNETGSSPEALRHSSMLILWGFNPVVTMHNPDIRDLLLHHRRKKTPVIVIDPHFSETAAAFSTQYIAIRPGTDAALACAMAWVIREEHLEDEDFLEEHCLGYDPAHMPEGYEDEISWKEYISGADDGTPKTPVWAEGITGIPADVIQNLAVQYALAKPAAILTGWGPQRHANGEQTTRAIMTLPCMTGNVGLEGGSTGGSIEIPQHMNPVIPLPVNPYGRSIPSFLWTDAVTRGTEMTECDDGVRGGTLASNIKLIFNLAGNALVNQHSDINRTVRILQDRSLCEFIIDSDLFMTSSARYADLVLPGTSLFEGEHMADPWEMGNYLLYGNRSIPPLFDSRFEFEWMCALAEKLGIHGFSEGCRTAADWNRLLYDRIRPYEPELPSFEQFRVRGGYLYRKNTVFTAFREQRERPGKVSYPTESGKIEIFSPALARRHLPDIPPLPRYVPAFEGVQDSRNGRFPLQLIGWHTKRRCHSVHDNNVRMEKLEPHRLWINPEDAGPRGLSEGDMAEIWNDRGRVRMAVHITGRIMKGVICIPQGAWYTPDTDGTDIRGCVNTLTTARPTPLAKGNPQHSALADVRRI